MSTLENKEDKMLDVKKSKTVYVTEKGAKDGSFVKNQAIDVSLPVAEKLVRSGKASFTPEVETTVVQPEGAKNPNPFETKK